MRDCWKLPNKILSKPLAQTDRKPFSSNARAIHVFMPEYPETPYRLYTKDARQLEDLNPGPSYCDTTVFTIALQRLTKVYQTNISTLFRQTFKSLPQTPQLGKANKK